MIDDLVREFYEQHQYPAPVDDLDAYRSLWDGTRRRAESALLWPSEPFRDDRTILVAGCGTMQAAHYAVRWPRSRVLGIDISANSLASSEVLKRRYGLNNLELRQLPVERAAELRESFEYVVCTGVLHHLADPEEGLRALRSVLAPKGVLQLMVYAPFGRAGIYLIQEYCRRLGLRWSHDEVAELASTLQALPPDHPLAPLLRRSPDFQSVAGLADALLHPRDRSYSVPELLSLFERCGVSYGRWIRQAPYLPSCGAVRATPHAPRIRALPREEQYAAMELFRGTMTRHTALAYGSGGESGAIGFSGDSWLSYVPVRLPDTIEVRDQLPPGAVAVLINRNHTYTDLFMPIDERERRLLAAVDGKQTIKEICRRPGDLDAARAFFEALWEWDQVVFDASRSRGAK